MNQLGQRPLSKTRKVYDNVHGFISFPHQVWAFIDTPAFQRLRNIKQLGCLHWVFPSAVHTRFEHSLGTGYLAQQYITALIENHSQEKFKYIYDQYHKAHEHPEYNVSVKQESIFIVTLAGVLHDVGHGAFSHLFDTGVVSKIKDKQGKWIDWEHEIASLHIIDHLYQQVGENYKKVGLKTTAQWIGSTKNRVKALIIGKIMKANYNKTNPQKYELNNPPSQEVTNLSRTEKDQFTRQLQTRHWEFELVSNRYNGIDVDKMDYFRRDAQYLGAKDIHIAHELLMKQTLILKVQDQSKIEDRFLTQGTQGDYYRLCFPSKYSDKVYDVFYSRYKLYRTYYQNLKDKGVDLMIAKILTTISKCDQQFNFTQICQQLVNKQPQRYLKLTDNVLQKIEDFCELRIGKIKEKVANKQKLDEKEQGILTASEIIEKLRKRQIFDFVQEYSQSFEFDNESNKGVLKHELIKDKLKTWMAKNQNDEYYLLKCDIGFGIKDKDPFKECKFYDKTKEQYKMEQNNENLFSMLKPNQIIQTSVRVYMKDKVSSQKALLETEKLKVKIYQELNSKEVDKDKGFISKLGGSMTNRPIQKQSPHDVSISPTNKKAEEKGLHDEDEMQKEDEKGDENEGKKKVEESPSSKQ